MPVHESFTTNDLLSRRCLSCSVLAQVQQCVRYCALQAAGSLTSSTQQHGSRPCPLLMQQDAAATAKHPFHHTLDPYNAAVQGAMTLLTHKALR